MRAGLRVDVDTFRGARLGVPALAKLLASHSVKASFFFSVGPDNMGRHLFRLLRPGFLLKMLRSGAPGLYGWDILLKGTLRPGPVIGERLADVIRATADAGHEVGFHAWDHHAWQANIDAMDRQAIADYISTGMESLGRILGTTPTCSAVPAWQCTDQTLLEKCRYPFVYNSDCRGSNIFLPVVDGKTLAQPQIPTTLPTYDETIGRDGISDRNYNERLISLVERSSFPVLAIHAEVEGIGRHALFADFLERSRIRGIEWTPLDALLPEGPPAATAPIVRGAIRGREGWMSFQGEGSS